jgi:hypothetical protein
MAVLAADRARTQRARETGTLEETKALFQRYVDGEPTSEELDRAFEACLDREYGPVRLPRNKRT